MGIIQNIKHDEFPKQGRLFKKRVQVCFHYDTDNRVMGTCIRDDAESPHETIFQLDDGRVVRAVECQYTW